MAGGSLLALVQSANAQRSARCTDDFLGAEHVLLALLDENRCGKAVLREAQPDLNTATLRAAIDQVRKNRRIILASGGDLRGPRKVRAGFDAGGKGRQARPGHRPRRRGAPRHDCPLAAYQEQPDPDRRARYG